MSTLQPERDRRRSNAAGHLATGGALVGAATGVNYLNDRALERKGLDKPVKTAFRRKKFKPAHGRYAATKLGVRGLQVTGIPMAAYGAYNLVRPDRKVPKVNAKEDIARQVARGVTFRDAADDYRKRVAKRQLTQAENEKLVRRKKLGRDLSLVGGTLGAAALGLRSPEIARAVASRSKRLAATRPVKRLVGMEPKATKVSNTLGIAAIGSGSVGSFNYASQQRLEAKQVKKGLQPYAMLRNVGRVRVTGMHSKDMFNVVDNKDVRRLVPRGRLTFIKTPGKRKPQGPVQQALPFEKGLPSKLRQNLLSNKPGRFYVGGMNRNKLGAADKPGSYVRYRLAAAQEGRWAARRIARDGGADAYTRRTVIAVGRSARTKARRIVSGEPKAPYAGPGSGQWKRWNGDVKKSDDRFLREHRDRISPDAERGYNSLRRQRNTDRAWAAVQGGLTAANAAGTVAALKMRSKPWTLIGGAATGFSASQAVRHGRKARAYDKGPMEGIRRKAKQREAAGLYAPGRGKEPVDASSRRVGKALVPRLPMPRSVPKGLRRTPGIRRSYVSRRPSGQLVSVRGGFG